MNGAGEEGEGGDVGKHFTVSWSLLNAHCPIFITLWGIVTEVNARQSPNAISPIRVTPSCMVTEVKALHKQYLQLIIPQYFISNKSGIWSLSLIVHSKG